MKARFAAAVLAALVPVGAAAQTPSPAPSPTPTPASTVTPVAAPIPRQGFAPPDGWVPDVQLMEQIDAAIPAQWKKPAGYGQITARFWGETGFSPADAARLTTKAYTRVYPRALRSRVPTVTAPTLCGAPGAIVTQRIVERNGTFVSEGIFESRNGILTVFLYSYLGRDDLAAERFVRTACPTTQDELASLRAPRGWTMQPEIHLIGAWTGPNGSDTLEEIDGPRFAVSGWADARRLDMKFRGLAGVSGAFKNELSTHCGGDMLREQTFTAKYRGQVVRIETVYLRTSQTTGHAFLYEAPRPDAALLAAMRAYCPR